MITNPIEGRMGLRPSRQYAPQFGNRTVLTTEHFRAFEIAFGEAAMVVVVELKCWRLLDKSPPAPLFQRGEFRY